MSPADKMSVAFIIDPIQTIKHYKDSTVAMIEAVQNLGHDAYCVTGDDLFVNNQKVSAIARKVTLTGSDQIWYSLDDARSIPLESFGLVLMRKDPPVDKRYIHTCYMLEQAQRNGAKVVNDPAALISLNEKLFAGFFPEFCPDTLIASDYSVLKNFLDKYKTIILKPLDAMGGAGVFMIKDDDVNFDVIWEMHTSRGTYPVIAQEFLPSISEGDKRVLVINGQPFEDVLVRSPKPGSIRGNMAAGGNTHVRKITAKEAEISRKVGQVLLEKKILFAGLDIIGDKLIEINITSPTGLREISKACGKNVAEKLMKEILS